MAVFIPVAVLASGFLAESVSAAPIVDQSYVNSLSEIDDEKMASIFSAIGNILKKPGVAGGILGTFGALAGGVGSVLGATGQKRDVAFEDMNDDEKMASIFSAIGNILKKPGVAGGILGTFGALAGGVGSVLGATGQKRDVAFDDMNDDEKMASIFSAIDNILKKPGVAGGILGTFGALAGGVGSVLGSTGHKRELAFDNMTDEEKVASIWKYIPDIAGALGGALGLGLGAYQHHQNGKSKRTVAYEDLSAEDVEKMASIFSAIRGVLGKPGVAGGILSTFGALAGGVGSVLGSTGHKREIAFDAMTDQEKVASIWKYIPDIAGALGGALGLGLGAYQHHQNGKNKRTVAYEDLSDQDVEKMASIFSAIGNVLKKPGVAGGILGTFGALAGGIGSVLGSTGHKREVDFNNMTDEEKEASFWKFIPDIAGAIGGVLGLGAGAYQHHQNGKQKRAADELTSLLNQVDPEDKEAFWKLVPAIAGAIGGALGLGAGAYQHVQNGKRAVHPHEINQLFSWKGLKGLFGIKRRDLEDMALLARMIDDSEFY